MSQYLGIFDKMLYNVQHLLITFSLVKREIYSETSKTFNCVKVTH